MTPSLPLRRAAPVVALGALLWACPPAPVAPPPDAGGSTLQLAAPALAALPAPPVLTPCPSGWAEVPGVDGAPATCEPWAADAGGGCASDQARFPGESACRVVGTPCSADAWATGLPASNVLYVDAQAAAGGSGTRAAPYLTVSAALAAAGPGAVVAVAKGTFVENVRLRPGVTVWGACTAQTVLRGTGGMAAVSTGGLGSGLRNLRVEGPAVGLLANPSGNSVDLQDVIIDATVGVALLVGNRAAVTGHDVVVRGTRVSASTGTGGRAMSVEYGGTVTLTRVVLDGNAENAVNVAEPGSAVSLTDAVIRGTGPRADGAMGRAASLRAGATLQLTRAVVEGNRESALLVGGSSTLQLTDVLVRDTLAAANLNDGGNGLTVETSATATLTRVALVRNRSLGVALRSQAQLTATHLVVTDTQVEPAGQRDGAGLDVREGAQLSLTHAFVGRSASAALGVSGARATLRDVELAVTTRSPADDASSGLQVKDGAAVTAERLRVRQAERVGVLVAGGGATLTGADVTVEDTRSTSVGGTDGTGLAAQGGAVVDVARLTLLGNRSIGLLALQSVLGVADLVVRDTQSAAGPGDLGRGVHVQDGTTLTLTRAEVSRARDVGLLVGLGSTVTATDLRVADTRKRACSEAQACSDLGGSAVVVLSPGSSLTATGFSLTSSAQCGVQLAEAGVATLSRGEVVGHVIGACVQTAGFDVARLSEQVDYRDNQRKLDAEAVPLPQVSLPPLR